MSTLASSPPRENWSRKRLTPAPKVAMNFCDFGVGPRDARSITYDFSLLPMLLLLPLPPRPRDGTTDSGVSRVLLRLLRILFLQNHRRNAIMDTTANPPMTLPATTAVGAPPPEPPPFPPPTTLTSGLEVDWLSPAL